MFIRRRRWNSLKLLLWFLFQHPRDLSSMDHPRVGSFQQAVGFASAGPIAAVRRLAYEAADAGLLSPELAAGISRVKGVKQLGHRSGNWLSAAQSSEVLQHASGDGMRAKRDYAMLAMLFGCGFRRSELVGLELNEIQMRQGHWAVVDLIGKGGHTRTVPIRGWVKLALDHWTLATRITEGKI